MIQNAPQARTEDRLLFGLTPFDDESFFGFTARLAVWNCFDSRLHLLKSAGFSDLRSQGLDAALNDCGTLARRLQLSEEQLDHLTGRRDPELRQYREQMALGMRRVSPTSLRKAAYHRAGWTLKNLPFCAESWDILVDRCPACDRRLGWGAVLEVELCEHCSFDLRTASTPQVPVSQRPMLSVLADLIGRDPQRRSKLLPNIPPCSSFLVFRLAMSFARAAAVTETGTKLRRSAALKRAEHMAAGMQILLGYPASFNDLLPPGNARLPEFFQEVHTTGEARRLFEQMFFAWEPCRHGPSRLRRRREDGGKLTLREAAQEMRLENRDVRRLIDGGFFGAPQRRGAVRKLQWLDPGDVGRATKILADRMSFQEFSQTFKIPVRGVAQMVSLGTLDRNQEPIVRELYSAPQLYRNEAEQFAGRLHALCHLPRRSLSVLPLEDAFHGIGGQEKPWGPVLRAVLEREITLYFEYAPSDSLQIGKLQISQLLASELLARKRPELLDVSGLLVSEFIDGLMTRVEIESYLNCFPRDLSWLITEGHISTTPRLDEVAELGRNLISSREINWRWRNSPALGELLTRDHGIKRVVGPFWLRTAVEEHFARKT